MLIIMEYRVDTVEEGTEANHEAVHDIVIINPDKKIRAIFSYPVTVGANPAEILRVLDALQMPAELVIESLSEIIC